ncbi:MAG: galactose mutarotase [Clostridia bacterium]|nr:galactose mutarotase [Clostridia bacterium]
MIEKCFFGNITDEGNSIPVCSYTITSPDRKIEAMVCEYGARLLRLRVSVGGEMRDVVRGFDDLDSYRNADGYFGAIVGRFGNRICRGRFSLDENQYYLYCNDGEHHLHGGKKGFDKKVWSSSEGKDGLSVVFSTVSPDGEEGYPGTLNVSVTYSLTAEEGLKISYEAHTDKKTVIGLTNHAYFNLAGEGYVGDHTVIIDADRYLPTDKGLIPTGELRSVGGTAFDFCSGKKISEALDSNDEDIRIGGGVDHCFVFTVDGDREKSRVTVFSPASDLRMDVFTDRPCVQFYTGNFLGDEKFPFRGGIPQKRRHAFCLETEGMPDAINHKNFINCTLSIGDVWKTETEYRFTAL